MGPVFIARCILELVAEEEGNLKQSEISLLSGVKSYFYMLQSKGIGVSINDTDSKNKVASDWQ